MHLQVADLIIQKFKFLCEESVRFLVYFTFVPMVPKFELCSFRKQRVYRYLSSARNSTTGINIMHTNLHISMDMEFGAD
jgi:hypothetical protein